MRERIERLIEEYTREAMHWYPSGFQDGVCSTYHIVIEDLQALLTVDDEVMAALQYCHDHAHPQQIIQDITGPLLKTRVR